MSLAISRLGLLAAAPERLDISVLKASIAIALVFAALVLVFQFGGALLRKMLPKRRAVRQSPEPSSWPVRTVTEDRPTASGPPDDRFQTTPSVAAGPRADTDDPERLQRACEGRANELADLYLELAECRLRHGQTAQAVSCFEKLLRCCPEAPAAPRAQERLRQLTQDVPPRNP